MVYFYGGAFVFGESSDEFHGPDYFMRKDIVLVTINYRVGILGKNISLIKLNRCFYQDHLIDKRR